MADKEFLDLFVRLKGDFSKLEKLQQSGINIKINLNFNQSNGGGFQKLEKLKKGLDIKVNLQFKGLEKLEQLKKGFTIPVTLKTGNISGKPGSGRVNTGPTSQQQLNNSEVERLNKIAEQAAKERKATTDRQLKALFGAQAGRAAGSVRNDQDLVDRVEKASALRRKDADRQLKQLFEAQSQRVKAAQAQIEAVNKYNQSIAPRSDINQERNRQAAIDEYNRRVAPRSAINQPELDARERERQRQLAQRRFREAENRRRAQEEFDISPIFTNANDQRRDIAFQRGLLPEDIRQTNRRLIDPRRLDKEALKEAAFAGLFGSKSGFSSGFNLFGPVGGLLGAGLGAAGSVGGSLVGSSVTPGGGLIGSTVAEIGLETFAVTLEGIKEKLLDVSRAGLQFEESILGISSVLQATTTVRGSDGKSLPIGQQLQFQEGQARKIQLTARKKLLPLGIGGETEAAIVQGIITGFAQKGVQLNPDEIATLASRIGGSVQAQRPDLLININRLRLEIEDSISNPGRNTALTPILRAFAPSLGKATSGQEALKFSAGLEAFPQALTSNTDNVVQALRQFNTEIENLKVNFGSDFLRGLTPAIENFTKVIRDSNVQESLNKTAGVLSSFFSFLINKAAELSQRLGQLQGGPNGTARTGTLVGSVGGAAGGALVGGLAGSILPGIGTLTGAAVGGVAGAFGGGAVGGVTALQEEAKAKELANIEFAKEQLARKDKLSAQTNAQTILNSLLGETAGEGQQKLGKANLAKLFLPLFAQETKENLNSSALKIGDEGERKDFVKSIDSQVGSAIREFESQIADAQLSGFRSSFEDRKSTFDTSLASGQASAAKFEIAGLGQERSLLNAQRTAKAAELAAIEEEGKNAPAKSKGDLNFLINQENKLTKAREELGKIDNELIKNTNAVSDAAKKLSAAFGTRLQEKLSTIDTGTLVGQEQALQTRRLGSTGELNNLRGQLDNGLINKQTFDLRSGQIKVEQAQQGRELELQPFNRGESFLSAEKGLFESTNLQADLNRSLQGYKLSVDQAALSTKEAALSQSKAARAIDDFTNETTSRRFGREGQKIAAAEKVVAAGGDVPFGVDAALVRGSTGFNEEARQQFERNAASAEFDTISRQLDPFRTAQEDSEELTQRQISLSSSKLGERSAKLQQEQAKRALEFEPIERATKTLDVLQNLVKLRQSRPQGSALSDRLTAQISKSPDVSTFLAESGFKDFADFEAQANAQNDVNPNTFDDISASEDFPAISPVADNVAAIRAILEKLVKPPEAPSGDKTPPLLSGDVFDEDTGLGGKKKFVAGPAGSSNKGLKSFLPDDKTKNPLSESERAKLGSDLFGAFSGADEVSSDKILGLSGNGIGGAIAGGLLGSDPSSIPGVSSGGLSNFYKLPFIPEKDGSQYSGPIGPKPLELGATQSTLPGVEPPLPAASPLILKSGSKGVFELGGGRNEFRVGSPSFEEKLEKRYKGAIEATDEEGFKAFLSKLNPNNPGYSELISTFYKWRYPPGNQSPNILDKFDITTRFKTPREQLEDGTFGDSFNAPGAELGFAPSSGGLSGSISNDYLNNPRFRKFANGGRPPLKKPSIVGERGPELFIPDSKGTVIASEILRGLGKSSGLNSTYTDQILNNNNAFDIFERQSGLYRGPGGNAVTPRSINTSTLEKLGSLPKSATTTPQGNKDLSAQILAALAGVQSAIGQQTKENAAAYKSALTSTFAGN